MYGIYANIGGNIDGIHVTIYTSTMDPMGKWILALIFQPQPSFGPLEKSCWKVSLGYPGCQELPMILHLSSLSWVFKD